MNDSNENYFIFNLLVIKSGPRYKHNGVLSFCFFIAYEKSVYFILLYPTVRVMHVIGWNGYASMYNNRPYHLTSAYSLIL